MTAAQRLVLGAVFLTFAVPQLGQTQPVAGESDTVATAPIWPDSSCQLPCLEMGTLLRTENHGFPTWLNQFPHHWMSRGWPFGQPRPLFVLGRPPWSLEIKWFDMEMNDPVYGVTALSTIPELGFQALAPRFPRGSHDITLLQQAASGRPTSRVYYVQGDNGLSHVDAQFTKGRLATGLFEIGGNFVRSNGSFDNSDVTSDRFRGRFSLPRGKFLVVYHFATGRSDAGFPGAVTESAAVQFQRLRRKSRRSDHLLRIHLPQGGGLKKLVQLTYHRDRLDYTDNVEAMVNTEDKIRWGVLSGLLSYRSGALLVSGGLHLFGAHATSLNPPTEGETRGREASFSEYPVGASLRMVKPGRRQQVALDMDFKYHNARWQSHRIRVDWQRLWAPGLTLSAAGFHEAKPPPLGWRHGRLLPFENQGWPVLYAEVDSILGTPDTPADPVVFRGGRLGVGWKSGDTGFVYGDVFVQQTLNLSFPRSSTPGEIRFSQVGDFVSTGMFLRAGKNRGDLHITATYQYHSTGRADSTSAGAIPDHRLWGRAALHRRFFKQNLAVEFALMGEAMSGVSVFAASNDFTELSRFSRESLFLLHAQIILKIGDAQVYFQWQNLTGVNRAIPGFYWPTTTTFQYGVNWSFID